MSRNLLMLCLCGLLAACQTAPKPDRSTMAMGFAEAAYGLGVEPEGRHAVVARDTLIRWESDEPVQLSIRGEPKGTPVYQAIVNELTSLFELAGLTLVTDQGLSRQLLRFEVKSELLILDEDIKTRCYTYFANIKNGYLKTVDIVATRSSVLEDNSCLLHEGMHALGFAGHPHRLHSVLSYTQGLNSLSKIDNRLIGTLYSQGLRNEMPLGEALTIAYSQYTDFQESYGKRYVPRDISLEIKENESPLVLVQSFASGLSKQFYYEAEKNGARSISANYGIRQTGQTFVDLSYNRLSAEHIYRKQPGAETFAKRYESIYGPLKIQETGEVLHSVGKIEYALVSSEDLSCVIIIKFINAAELDLGNHELLYGNYCTSISKPLVALDAEEFIQAIRIYDRDPVQIRQNKIATGKRDAQAFSAIRMTGQWPIDSTAVWGLKLIERGNTEGSIKIRVRDEVCDGNLSNIGSNGQGKWVLQCEENESAEGRFSWDSDGTISFKGNTLDTGQEINWVGHQVF